MGDRSAPSFAALVQRFFVVHLGQHRAVSPQTIAAYRDTFRLLLAFAETSIGKTPSAVTLTDLNAQLLLDFLDHLEKARGNSARSRNARLAALRTFLKYAGHHDLEALGTIEQALAIPMKRTDRPLIGFLTRSEIQAILNAPDDTTWAGQRDRVLFSLMYNTGARVSEIIGVRCCDVVLDGQAAVHLHGKGRKERCVPLWRPTAALVRRWQRLAGANALDGFLLPNRAGGKMTRANVTQRLDLAVDAATRHLPSLAGRSISPHVIRHSTAMHLLQSGVDITVIALWLGHEDTATTHMYVEADLSMKELALAKLQPQEAKIGRYRPPDQLIRFLEAL
ncbi:tyrosine-type recombinase/integrase [Rhizobium sp. 007]|uniref:tyrosine-type recombinase/integrase n=1 Tax=Rhizobium sp. 007 TaxID=2785056 RepID=UPI0018906685|nr:tyrosine-type recombinase/integrase [Rhizobium sp. 007]QPB24212.1 tyrosine-type recombinase/integrase [Rhizobium sp. 007]